MKHATESKNDLSIPYSIYWFILSVRIILSVHRENKKFKKGGSKGHSLEGNGWKCVFCDGDHWSDKCRVVSHVHARKDLLKKGNRFHVSEN